MGVYKYKRKKNVDPKNPYTPGSIWAALYEEDFSDLTISEIADVFGVETEKVRRAIRQIQVSTKIKICVKKEE